MTVSCVPPAWYRLDMQDADDIRRSEEGPLPPPPLALRLALGAAALGTVIMVAVCLLVMTRALVGGTP